MRSVTEKAVGILLGSGKTVAVAESLTAGLLAAEFVCVPGVSAVFRGGVVSYATDLKISLLGVDAELAEREGVVNAPVALQMAQGAAECCGSGLPCPQRAWQVRARMRGKRRERCLSDALARVCVLRANTIFPVRATM